MAVSFAHNTASYRFDVPSATTGDGFVSAPALTYASAGFAAVAPDYLGLGAGPGFHPWMDVSSETTASLDMLRHPTGRLAAALRVADSTCDGSPRVPLRLYEAAADEQAANANTGHCEAALRSRGVDAPVVNLGSPDYQGSRHLGSNAAGTAAVVRWFSRLR